MKTSCTVFRELIWNTTPTKGILMDVLSRSMLKIVSGTSLNPLSIKHGIKMQNNWCSETEVLPIVSWILKSPNTVFQTVNPFTYKVLRPFNPQRHQFIMPCHIAAKHHHKNQLVKPGMEDSFLDNNRISTLVSEMKNGIIICYLKSKNKTNKPLWS